MSMEMAESLFHATSILLEDTLPGSPCSAEISITKPYIWQWLGKAPEEWQCRLYNERSSKCNDALMPAGIRLNEVPQTSVTGIPVDELRYQG